MSKDYIEQKVAAIENTDFTHIPGPNPILMPGKKGSWDDNIMEVSDILKDDGKYYLYYHAEGCGENYRIGVAVADNPMGPFIKYGDKPILDLKNFGVSNDSYIACGSVIKESVDEYYLFYSLQQKDDPYNYYIGLATAKHPLGPWEKYENNPIMKNFGYVGGITKKDGKYYMFNEYPTTIKAQDYGTISVATADKPQGPWTPCYDFPVLELEDWGVWDDAGYSECNVKYDGTMFHMFYGGAKTDKVRLRSQESIGYAYSVDGKHFTKYSKNPVAKRENIAYGAAMAEVCFLIEYPYIYLYHTLRYNESWCEDTEKKFQSTEQVAEHLGVEVLCIADHFNLSYPVYSLDELLPQQTYFDKNKLPLTVAEAKEYSITVSCQYSDDAKGPLEIHLLTGVDEKSIDTIPYASFKLDVIPGKKAQKTFSGNIASRFMRVVFENTDSSAPVKDISVSITLKN